MILFFSKKIRYCQIKSDNKLNLIFAGNIRRFRRVCEHIQSQVCSRNVSMNLGGQSRAAPPSPRASRKFTTEMSESSSCGSDTSERLFLSPHPATRQVVCFNKVAHHSSSLFSLYHNNYYFGISISLKSQTKFFSLR